MSGSISGPGHLGLEQDFGTFTQTSGWHLSLPAKVILQQGLLSMATDVLGMGDIQTGEQRRAMISRAREALPKFLSHIAAVAEKEIHERANQGVTVPEKVIGGVLVLQHMPQLASLINCTCWPPY